jgi:hypothetical protein
MADEQSRAPFNKPSPIPNDLDWQSLLKRDDDELETHYRHVPESLGKMKGCRSTWKTVPKRVNRHWREVNLDEE